MRCILFSFAVLLSSAAFAGQGGNLGLVIHTSEIGVGKFHRYDNKVHAYGDANSWSGYILPDNAVPKNPLAVDNADGSVTVFFNTLDDLIQNVITISKAKNLPVSVLNVHGHGLPGAMWFPADDKTLKSTQCSSWRSAAEGADEGNYSQYYSPVSQSEIMQIRAISNSLNFHMGCTTGLDEWTAAVAKAPEFKTVFATDAQIHFLSCVVGLGKSGDRFVKGIAQLLLNTSAGRVEASTNFGLGDWSMAEGMGFWDFQTTSQLNHDNEIYPKDKTDREIMQKGVIRLATYSAKGWETSLWAGRDFMAIGFETAILGYEIAEMNISSMVPVPAEIRVPGTSAFVSVSK